MSEQTTSTTSAGASSVHNVLNDEMILVVKRDDIFSIEPAWSGLRQVSFDSYLNLISSKREFLPRTQMESDPKYKQIIPYLVFTHGDRYFLMQRTSTSTEKRLSNKYSLGIGGHVRQEDMEGGTIFDWAQREFHEEVEYNGSLTFEPLGVLNDDSNAVGQVHIGLVVLVKGDNDAIKVKSELKSGQLMTLAECEEKFSVMESWSQTVFTHLLAHAGVR